MGLTRCYKTDVFVTFNVTNDLSPSHHIAVIVTQAHKRACAILRAFRSRDNCLLMRAFLVYVRPSVEYNSIIWSPATILDIDSLESVQRRFTKWLLEILTIMTVFNA